MLNISEMSNRDLLVMVCGDVGNQLDNMKLTELFGMEKHIYPDSLFSEDILPYSIHPKMSAAKELYLRAMQEAMTVKDCLSSADHVKHFLRGKLGHLEHEVFVCLFLDSQNRIIKYDEVANGTVTQCSIFPREVLKRGISVNACSVIVCHNHPSGITKPSRADELLTQTLKTTLALVDIRVLDHIIVSGQSSTSMAEIGLL
ncbi:JAB domain-containing protein [Rhodoferax antarcticus]|uniref:DNA repair RadC family protein n=1 Tax=Rhodoferax antarcticus ANT.BR TaxID=1111071 RepID=A0A1Q8Y9J9_9BURK|nr:DNA repair protein RadC [Rhodoferax antarcticus]OLP04617.1 DNA repair RadC family protein [Rhodoferax antarcticus ANT.BR]